PAIGGLVFSLTNSQSLQVSQVVLESQRVITAVYSGLDRLNTETETMLISRNTEKTQLIEDSLQMLDTSIDVLAITTLGVRPGWVAANRALSSEIRTLGDEYVEKTESLVQAARSQDWGRAGELSAGELDELGGNIENTLDQIRGNLDRDVRVSIETATRVQNFLRVFWPATMLSSMALIVIIVVSVSRSIVGPIQELTGLVRRLTQRDFSPFQPLETKDELGELSRAFATLTNWLQESYETLEQRVRERTRDLERRTLQIQVAAEVARDATRTQNLEELLNNAVELIRGRFGYYHAGIFLVDEAHEHAVLMAATGEPGRAMLEAGHRLRVGEIGIVGYVTGSGRPRIALDVGQDTTHFRNPHLPETRAEMALPLKISGRIIGALDVQSRFPDAFSEQDITALQVMADQLAIAIENTRLLEESRQNLAEIQNVYGKLNRQSWQDIRRGMPQSGYEYDRGAVHPLQPGESGLQSENDGDEELVHLCVPLRVRGEAIGSIDFWADPESVNAQTDDTLAHIGDRIGQALESARLFEEARNKAEREEIISTISASIQETLDIDMMLQTAIREIGNSMQVEEVEVRMKES
ncbi:MAG: GAF domain-containing protein, partial [Anaerolineales bacterium]